MVVRIATYSVRYLAISLCFLAFPGTAQDFKQRQANQLLMPSFTLPDMADLTIHQTQGLGLPPRSEEMLRRFHESIDNDEVTVKGVQQKWLLHTFSASGTPILGNLKPWIDNKAALNRLTGLPSGKVLESETTDRVASPTQDKLFPLTDATTLMDLWKRPDLEQSDSRMLWKILRGLDRQEVQPDFVDDMVRERFPIPQPRELPSIEGLSTPSELARQKSCGNAVRYLRSTPVLPSGRAPGDRIKFFYPGCLLVDSWRSTIPPLSEGQKRRVAECSTAYNTYSNQCFGNVDPANNSAIMNNIGVLVTMRNDNRREILCTATLVNSTKVISARHCLPQASRSLDGTTNLMFIPFREMGRQSSYGIEFAQLAPGYSILPLSEAVDRIDTGMAALGWANDLVLLSIEKGTEVAGVSEVKPTQVQGLTRVQLPGFQRLLVHKMLAEARLSNKPLFDDEILLQTGMWRRAVATDFSPTCLLIPLMHEEASRLEANIVTNFGHTCQSLDKTSGAPLFEFDGPELRLVAIHNGALSFNGDDNPAIPVEATSPKNLAVLALGALNAR